MENTPQRKQQIQRFVERWQAAEGNEDREARSFLIEFLQDVLGIDNATHVLDFERRVKGRKVDAFNEDMGILIEAKSREQGILDKPRDNGKYGFETPYQQAKWYADNMPNTIRPRWIIVTDFDEFRIHDLNLEHPGHDYQTVTLEELTSDAARAMFGFFTDRSQSRLVREKELSVEAGAIVGRLYDAFARQFHNLDESAEEQRSLNVLIVRLVFLLYAEDAGLLQEHQAFCRYMEKFDVEQSRQALLRLFEVLDTPEDQRDPYLRGDLLEFPYVNGSLFSKENIIVPQFSEEIRDELLQNASRGFDWKDISPTIFGAVFESTLNPETRRAGGMHYTSIENIHKVIDPLFMDGLRAELAEIEGIKIEKTRKLRLRAFQEKLASLDILDPACGSGNFLTESYIQLRKLENRVIESLQGEGQVGMGFSGEDNPVRVSISQFYGIEINDFAVSVAKTALWIAESQMLDETQDLLLTPFDFFPLTTNAHVVQGNALRMDWNDLLPAEKCDYIIGNPPFIGYSNQSAEQKQEMLDIWLDEKGKPIKAAGKIDYVSAWYRRAAEYMRANTVIRAAFVSTNSICQGEQVAPIWKTLKDLYGVHIDFAWQTFVWDSEASEKARVHVVIIGFSIGDDVESKLLFSGGGHIVEADNINGYLVDAPDVFVIPARASMRDVPAMSTGNRPADGGNLIIEDADKEAFIADDPLSERYIRPFLGSKEFINGKPRWCLWLVNMPPEELDSMPKVRERVSACREDRLAAPDAGRRKLAETPTLFREQKEAGHPYLVVPEVSSERREYIPIGYVPADTICSNLLFIVPDGGLYEFGVLTSQAHNAWMRAVAGRLEMRYRYSQNLVYNTFPWPNPMPEQREAIEVAAQAVLDARDAYPGATLADLYDPDKTPADLLTAHKALDAAVEAAYGVDFGGDEEKIVAHLFKLYAEATKDE